MKTDFRPSPLALTVLGMLVAEPLHPYAIQTRIKAWGKDQVVNVGQRANLYKTIERLRAAGLIAVSRTERDQRFPERTVYELTEEGRAASREWLTGMLSLPRNEFPEFPAALSFLFELPPDEVRTALDGRAQHLRATLATLDGELHAESAPPRLFLLETEYLRAVTATELEWVEKLVHELDSGELSWSYEEIAAIAERFPPPE